MLDYFLNTLQKPVAFEVYFKKTISFSIRQKYNIQVIILKTKITADTYKAIKVTKCTKKYT